MRSEPFCRTGRLPEMKEGSGLRKSCCQGHNTARFTFFSAFPTATRHASPVPCRPRAGAGGLERALRGRDGARESARERRPHARAARMGVAPPLRGLTGPSSASRRRPLE